ncbi:MAG: NAD-dependent epimerase/dehydratase family protein [Verrucomicrobia bacterium]|jgi:UDP-2-acetamido-2,6-beta-L-arabino-hexul-4-ose reductase|nr:NAD-dependent epimerase/dehydratase family protein [Verrucomicrobiota bacterium]
MRIVITGADGFIGRNLALRLGELGYLEIVPITLESTRADLLAALSGAGFVFHLAGVNRPKDVTEFATGNTGVTEELCDALVEVDCAAPVVLSSSTQAALDNPYGLSKRAAEDALLQYGARTATLVYLFRLTNVFGKWAQPNYNSAVATFCHNIARGLDISINDPSAALRLVYVDDVVSAFVELLAEPRRAGGFVEAGPEYETTVGEVAQTLRGFAGSRASMLTDRVGSGLVRALYSTYLSYLLPESFAYAVPRHTDPRGEFVEMLKTLDCGQFSYFTAPPGITRGEHYHHSKAEKFLVIRGTARFGFRQVVTGERHDLVVKGGEARIVETVPGWTHNVTNIGDDEMIVMLWANEIFDPRRPDTFAMKVNP